MQRTAFSIVVLITLGFMGFFGLVVWQPELFAGLLGRATAGHIGEHFREHHHRVHDLTFSFLLGTAVVGMVPQLRAPQKNVAGQLMALIPFVGLLLSVVLTNTAVLSIPWIVVGSFTVLAATLHPAGRELVGALSVLRASRPMLALVVIAAVPLLAFAFVNIGLQRTAADDHAVLGHYGFMAAFSFTVIGVGLLASLRPDGWRLTAWMDGFLAGLLGVASLVFPDVPSALGVVWALAAITWGIAFVAAAELIGRRQPQTPRPEPPQVSDSDPYPSSDEHTRVGTQRGSTMVTLNVRVIFGVVVIGLVLLFVVMHLTGGGLGPHM
jgi:hypothetical protein